MSSHNSANSFCSSGMKIFSESTSDLLTRRISFSVSFWRRSKVKVKSDVLRTRRSSNILSEHDLAFSSLRVGSGLDICIPWFGVITIPISETRSTEKTRNILAILPPFRQRKSPQVSQGAFRMLGQSVIRAGQPALFCFGDLTGLIVKQIADDPHEWSLLLVADYAITKLSSDLRSSQQRF